MSDTPIYDSHIQTVSSIPCPHYGHLKVTDPKRLVWVDTDEGMGNSVHCIADEYGVWWQVVTLHAPLKCNMSKKAHYYDEAPLTHSHSWTSDNPQYVSWTDDTDGAVSNCEVKHETHSVTVSVSCPSCAGRGFMGGCGIMCHPDCESHPNRKCKTCLGGGTVNANYLNSTR
jgi:hypothetical protein